MLRKLAGSLWETLKFFVIVAAIVLPLRAFVAQPFIVSGASMDPTYHDQEYIIVDELSYFLRAPARGEVIVFRYPNDPSKHFIKRIIGLPGETVRVDSGGVFINGVKLNEVYLSAGEKTTGTGQAVTLGPNDYFVLGDNRPVSLDSRVWGTLARHLITGRAFVRLFPLGRVGVLTNQ